MKKNLFVRNCDLSKLEKFLIFFCKKSPLFRKRNFQGIKSFDTHCTATLPPYAILKKNAFSQKDQVSFQKHKKNIPVVLSGVHSIYLENI